MQVHVADHPLISHKLTVLRDVTTDSPTFRRLTEELVTLLAYEATRGVRVEPVDVATPVTLTTGVRLSPRNWERRRASRSSLAVRPRVVSAPCSALLASDGSAPPSYQEKP